MAQKAQAEGTAEVTWSGSLADGKGTIVDTGSGALQEAGISWAARVGERSDQTSPEELLAAAHAACYAMAFSHELTGAGHAPESLIVNATVGFDPKVGGGYEVSFSKLVVRGHVPGMDEAEFKKLAQAAGKGCPISGALKGNVEVLVEASMV
ncbi:MAG TPA: OsmC family peroxiredoxin [Thermomicrobiales bacterium]|nr:OsmC family peroxiredoxin [Thermomicrobiales bacterium]